MHRARARAMVAALGALALACAAAAPAAADGGESALGVSLTYARLAVPEHTPQGAALALDYRRGLTDAIWLRGALLGGALHEDAGTGYVAQAALGITYALDVLKYVPYVDVGFAAALVGGGGLTTEVHPLIELGLGLDILTGRTWSWGPFVHLAALDDATLTTVGLRVAYRWGFF